MLSATNNNQPTNQQTQGPNLAHGLKSIFKRMHNYTPQISAPSTHPQPSTSNSQRIIRANSPVVLVAPVAIPVMPVMPIERILQPSPRVTFWRGGIYGEDGLMQTAPHVHLIRNGTGRTEDCNFYKPKQETRRVCSDLMRKVSGFLSCRPRESDLAGSLLHPPIHTSEE